MPLKTQIYSLLEDKEKDEKSVVNLWHLYLKNQLNN